MIVVAIIGILAAVAIPAFMDYIKRSKMTEASLQLNKLGKNSKRVYLETSQYIANTHTPTTPDRPGAGGCCGGSGTAGNHPNHCASDPSIWTLGAWPALDFEVDEDTLFVYDYRGSATEYTAMATGDLDCDGTEITFMLNGTAVNGQPAYQLIEPPASAD